MNQPAHQLATNLLMAAISALGAEGSTTSPMDRKRLFDSVVAIENACVIDGKFKWINAGGTK